MTDYTIQVIGKHRFYTLEKRVNWRQAKVSPRSPCPSENQAHFQKKRFNDNFGYRITPGKTKALESLSLPIKALSVSLECLGGPFKNIAHCPRKHNCELSTQLESIDTFGKHKRLNVQESMDTVGVCTCTCMCVHVCVCVHTN